MILRRARPVAWIVALGALVWVLVRSGPKPSRLTYPCQQASLQAFSLILGASLVAVLVGLRRRAGAALLVLLGVSAVLALGTWSARSPAAPPMPDAAPSADYRATVFHQVGCAPDPVGDRFPGLDDLIEMMGGHGLKFYRSATPSLVAGPDGIVAAGDVVVIKINYQWPERGGTNTDLLRGLVRRIVQHPDGFTGEVVVAENAQFNSTLGFDRPENNAQDPSLSPHDVVAGFQAEGWAVSAFDWTTVRTTSVLEYSAGDLRNGYVVGAYDPRFYGRVSYPKFQSASGTRISLKHGVWTEGAGYDRTRLKFLNVPVLKSHHSTYGATACIKHYMGVVTGELSTNSHLGIGYGLLGQVIAEIGLADLNILDAIWINADPNSGPATTYEGASRRDELVASRDPVAADRWAVKNILIPGFEANGFSPPWPTPSADPDDPNSAFRRYLDRSMGYIVAAGYDVTNDPARTDAIDTAPPGEALDLTVSKDPEGYALHWSPPARGGAADSYNLYRVPLAAPGSVPACEAPLGTGTEAILPALADDAAFLVVGRNGVGDGSFGHDSRDRERPGPATACP